QRPEAGRLLRLNADGSLSVLDLRAGRAISTTVPGLVSVPEHPSSSTLNALPSASLDRSGMTWLLSHRNGPSLVFSSATGLQVRALPLSLPGTGECNWAPGYTPGALVGTCGDTLWLLDHPEGTPRRVVGRREAIEWDYFFESPIYLFLREAMINVGDL